MPEQEPLDPADCPHKETDRVGAFEIVCYQCKHIADWRKLLQGVNDWKPLGGEK